MCSLCSLQISTNEATRTRVGISAALYLTCLFVSIDTTELQRKGRKGISPFYLIIARSQSGQLTFSGLLTGARKVDLHVVSLFEPFGGHR